MALLGCDVIATDQIEVLPLLMRNAERNTSRIMQKDSNSGVLGYIWIGCGHTLLFFLFLLKRFFITE